MWAVCVWRVQKGNLEQRLVEIQSQYQAQLFSLAQLAGGLEGELASVRESALQQSRAYQLLLSTKVQLEREISTYKALIEGAGDFTVCMVKTPTVNVVPLATGGEHELRPTAEILIMNYTC